MMCSQKEDKKGGGRNTNLTLESLPRKDGHTIYNLTVSNIFHLVTCAQYLLDIVDLSIKCNTNTTMTSPTLLTK